MQLAGIHHVTAITADAQANVDFYVGVLGLRLVKKTVNFDDPYAYHLYYGDDAGAPGSIMTFFEYADAPPGRAGDGMIHRVIWRVADADAIGWWQSRLADHDVPARRDGDVLFFADREGLEHELVVDASGDEPRIRHTAPIPEAVALRGIEGVRARSATPAATAPFLAAALGITEDGGTYAISDGVRGGVYRLEPSSPAPGRPGAGTIHHVAWGVHDLEQLAAFGQQVVEAGGRPSGILDRTYFRSVYFREPSGVLFELASLAPGFATDEEPAHLGEALRLPPQHEHLRPLLEVALKPLRAGDPAR